MHEDDFQWDDAKAARNVARHGVSFAMAREVFNDPFAIEWADNAQSAAEMRFATVGMADNNLIFVAYAMRGDQIRIISARLAEPYERRRYHNEKQT